MSITYCHNCGKNIDEDVNLEHFDVCGKEECKVCGELTELVFNIKGKETPVCQKCATAITKQELQSMFAIIGEINK